MALNLDFSNLSTYTDQITLPIIRNTVLPSSLMDIGINYQENVTNISVLNIMTQNLVVKAGGACAAFAGTTGSTLYQNTIATTPCLIENEDCPDKFKLYWTKIITKAGSYNESDPDEYSRIYTSYLLEQTKARVEDLFFSGSSTGTYSATLTSANGILHNLEITNPGTYVTGATAYTGALTVGNAINAFYDSRSKLPTNVLGEDDLVWLINYADFFTLTQALTAQNYFNQGLYNGGAGETVNKRLMIKNILGTNITVYPMRGLNSKSRRIMTNASNLYLGTDLSSDYEKVRVWYSMDFQTIRTQIKWVQGATVAFPQNVVLA